MNTPNPSEQPTPAVASSDLLADMELVHRQLHCVQHLCKVVTTLSEAQIQMLPGNATNADMGHHMIKMAGLWANWFMQQVGGMLDDLSVDTPEEHKRWQKTFEQASERWNDENGQSRKIG